MIAKNRVVGSLNNLIDSKMAVKDRGALESVAYDVADAAIIIYREKVAAGLRRAGIEFRDDESITTDKILEAVKVKSGMDLASFDIEEIKTKALRELSTDISNRLGFEIDLRNGVQAGIDGAVVAAIKVGGGKLVGMALKTRLRRLKLAELAGVSPLDVKRVYNAKRQAEWRKSAAATVWVNR